MTSDETRLRDGRVSEPTDQEHVRSVVVCDAVNDDDSGSE